MPTITLNKKQVLNLIGKKLSDKILEEKIPMLGVGLEEITKDEITLEVFPNRPDMLSEQGFSRALSSFLNIKTGLREYKIKSSKEKVIIDPSVKQVRPFTACAIVKNLRLNEEKINEIIQLQEKLHITFGRNRKKLAIGIYPFEKIKPPIRYLALEPEKIKFIPLDYNNELTGEQILREHPTGREYAHLLENSKVYPIFIDSNKEILSMPPIINSETTGKITEKTKDVFIECSGFDFNILNKCLNIIVTALADLGADIYSMELKYKNKTVITPNLKPEVMKLDIEYANKLLGLKLNQQQIKKLLSKMGLTYEEGKVLIPAYRTDILHQFDLVEELAIAYGYENFNPEIPKVATIAEENKFEIFKNKIADTLVGFGLIETNTFNITNKDSQITKMNIELKPVELANALTSEYNTLRTWMIPSLLEVLKLNKHNEYPQNIFEINKIFKSNLEENERLAVLLCHSKASFTEAKQILDSLLSLLDLDYKIEETEHKSFIPGRVGRVYINNKAVAYIGEIHPSVLNAFELETPVACFELNVTELFGIRE